MNLVCLFLNQSRRVNGVSVDIFDFDGYTAELLAETLGTIYGDFANDSINALAEFYSLYEIPENGVCSGLDYMAGQASHHNQIHFGQDDTLNRQSINLFGSKRLFACYALSTVSDTKFGVLDEAQHACGQTGAEYAVYGFVFPYLEEPKKVLRLNGGCPATGPVAILPGGTFVGYTLATKEVTCFSYVEKGCLRTRDSD